MARATAQKFSSLMDKRLLSQLKRAAERNGQSLRFVLEKAVEHYLEVVTPSWQTIRPEVLETAKRVIAKRDRLLHRLAKA